MQHFFMDRSKNITNHNQHQTVAELLPLIMSHDHLVDLLVPFTLLTNYAVQELIASDRNSPVIKTCPTTDSPNPASAQPPHSYNGLSQSGISPTAPHSQMLGLQ